MTSDNIASTIAPYWQDASTGQASWSQVLDSLQIMSNMYINCCGRDTDEEYKDILILWRVALQRNHDG